MARGNNRQKIFLDELDFRIFLNILAAVKERKPFKLFAYCLMTNHFHLLMEMDEVPIWSVMQRVLLRYSKYFNKRHSRVGHLFQARYKPLLCDKDEYLLTVLRYVHLNPVIAGLASYPEHWPWSSHNDYLRPSPSSLIDSAFPLACLSTSAPKAIELYSKFVHQGIGVVKDSDIDPPEKLPCLGPPELISKYLDSAQRRGLSPELRERNRRSIDTIGLSIALSSGVSLEQIRSYLRTKRVAAARRDLAIAAAQAGWKLTEIGRYLDRSCWAISKMVGESH